MSFELFDEPAPKKKSYGKLPYPKKTVDGRRLYEVEPGRWVSRQRAHQIWHGYSYGPEGRRRTEYTKERQLEHMLRYHKYTDNETSP